MDTATADEGDELIDIRVRLPRRTVEQSLLFDRTSTLGAADRRLREARVLLTGRRRRGTCFSGVHFCDPSWDMILELFVATGEDRSLTVTQLCSMSGGSTTTALRHIEHLEALGYVARRPDARDRRRANIAMLPPLAKAVDAWLDQHLVTTQVGC